jgi:hypothetical protein
VVIEAILNREPTAPVRLNPDLPPKLEEIIARALEKDRKLRFQHTSDMRAELQRIKRDSDSGRSIPLLATQPFAQGAPLKTTAPARRLRLAHGRMGCYCRSPVPRRFLIQESSKGLVI